MRLVTPLIFIVLFVGWMLYRALIKRDLRQHKNDVLLGLFFMAVWAALYFMLWHY